MTPLTATALAVILIIAVAASTAVGEDTIFNGESLAANEFIERSPYKFIMQSDCNLVLYTGTKALWSSRTNGKGGGAACKVTLQDNGNLVLSAGTNVLWTSNTARGSGVTYRLVVQGDGNTVIYGAALWATNTVQGSRKHRRLLSV